MHLQWPRFQLILAHLDRIIAILDNQPTSHGRAKNFRTEKERFFG